MIRAHNLKTAILGIPLQTTPINHHRLACISVNRIEIDEEIENDLHYFLTR